MRLVPVIIFLNVLVFILWQWQPDNSFMMNNFTVSWQLLAEGRYWVLITSVFSHNMLIHLFINMFVLQSFGTLMERVLGTTRFLRFYLMAGILSSLTHATVSAWLLHKPDQPAVGASGAISGLVLLFSLMFPREKILLFGLIPLPALVGALAFIGLDIWGLIAQYEGGGLPIGHGAHLGGAFTGIFYFFYLRRQRRRYA